MGSEASRGGTPGSLPAIVYEREEGAASVPLPANYRRREPEKTVLHRVVRENVETLFDEAQRNSPNGQGYPGFVKNEFERYLGCGILSRGFCRLRCPECGFERLVAFSCKGRLCPSCWARRAADTAAHLVDRVLPEAPYRQFVLTFPWPMRFPLAFDDSLLSRMIKTYLRALFTWQRRRGKSLGIRDGRTGAVTFIQRFGGALNLNPHLHSLLPDGLFVPGPGQDLVFEPLPPPTPQDIETLTHKISRRLTRMARAAGLGQDEGPAVLDEDRLELARAMGEAMVPMISSRDLFESLEALDAPKGLCANVEGFALHAGRTVAAHDRLALEKLCRYGLRSPLSQERLSLLSDGRVRYVLRKPWPTASGITEMVLDPVKFLKRLCALIPRPYANLVRYHGILANRSKDRALLPRPESRATEIEGGPALNPVKSTARPHRTGWARLLRRVLQVDALECARCGAAMVVLAFITEMSVVKAILEHLKLPSREPERLPARRVEDEQERMFEQYEEGGEEGSSEPPGRASRGPP
jgi:hypothetical protein